MAADNIRPHHLPARALSEMCAEFGLEAPIDGDLEAIEITGVSSNHQSVEAGDLFVAIGDQHSHGARFAVQARQAGAVAILTDLPGASLAASAQLPVLVVDDPRLALGHIARWVYRTDPHEPRLFGVAASLGKTSVTHLIADLLDRLGASCAVSSSIERRCGDVLVLAEDTTPQADKLHALTARMREEGNRTAAIELSAKAIAAGRLTGLEFAVVGPLSFTPPQQERAAYEQERFVRTHRMLLDPDCAAHAVIDIDTPAGLELVELARVPVATLSAEPNTEADWHVSWQRTERGQTAFVVRSHDDRVVRSQTGKLGRLAALNAAAAIAMVAEAGWACEQIQDALDRTGGFDVRIPGRFEQVAISAGGIRGYLDTDSSLAGMNNALSALRAEASVLTVILKANSTICDGVPQALSKLSDRVIVVGDTIVTDVMRECGVRASEQPTLEHAIHAELADAKRGDVLLVLEPHPDAQRTVDEPESADSTVELLRRAFDDIDT